MAKYRLSSLAYQDIISIWDYTVKEWSASQAEKYYNLILASCEDLAKNPKFGKSYDIVSKNILGYKCGQHIIFYREASENEIEIIRILHGQMNLKDKL